MHLHRYLVIDVGEDLRRRLLPSRGQSEGRLEERQVGKPDLQCSANVGDTDAPAASAQRDDVVVVSRDGLSSRTEAEGYVQAGGGRQATRPQHLVDVFGRFDALAELSELGAAELVLLAFFLLRPGCDADDGSSHQQEGDLQCHVPDGRAGNARGQRRRVGGPHVESGGEECGGKSSAGAEPEPGDRDDCEVQNEETLSLGPGEVDP